MRRKKVSPCLTRKEMDHLNRLAFAFNTDGREIMGFVKKNVDKGQHIEMELSPYWKDKLGLEIVKVIRLENKVYNNSDVQYKVVK